MVLCPTGSTTAPGAGLYRWITWYDAQTWLGSVWAKFNWIGYLIPPILVQTSVFCATEPVQPTYPSDATIAAASTDPAAFETVLTYLKEAAIWWAWRNVCECNASGTPACTTAIWNHATTLALAPTATNEAVAFQGHVTVGTETLWGLDLYTPVSEAVQIFHFDVPTTYTVFENASLVAGWNRVYFATPHPLGVGETIRTGMRRPLSGDTLRWGAESGHTHSATSPVVLDGWATANWDFTGLGISGDDHAVDPVICLQSPAAYQPAAPPVPTTNIPDVPVPVCTTIGDLCAFQGPQVLDISLLKQRLDLLQRRLLPFAWIPGTALTGLTGTGYVAVTDALGCIVTLTTVPGGWGSTAETPRRLIPTAGSLQAGDGTNYDDWRQIHYEHEVYIFGTSWATRINYNFRLGFVATLTPIYPEP